MGDNMHGKHSKGNGKTTSPESSIAASHRRWHTMPLVVALIALALFCGLLICIMATGKGALPIDEAVLSFAISLRNPLLTSVMTDVTVLVMPSVLIAVSVSLCALGHSPRFFVAALIDAGAAVSLNWLIKHLIARPRPPEELRMALETSTSFPSSHAITAIAFYGFIIWLVLHYHQPSIWRNILVGILAIIVVLIGLSRIYLAVHYLTDVVAGFSAGIVWLTAFTRIIGPKLCDTSDYELESSH